MSESSKEGELNSIDQTSITDQLADKSVEEKPVMREDIMDTANDVETVASREFIDLPSLPENDTHLKEPAQAIDFTTVIKDVQFADDEKCNLFVTTVVEANKTKAENSTIKELIELKDSTTAIKDEKIADDEKGNFSATAAAAKSEISHIKEPTQPIESTTNIEGVNISDGEQRNASASIDERYSTEAESSPIKELSPHIDSRTTTKKDTNIVDVESSNSSAVAEERSTTKAESSLIKDENVTINESQHENSKENSRDEHAEHVTYTDDGTAIYTDPETNYQYKWCTKENKWTQSNVASSKNAYENEHYKWCSKTQKWIPKQTQITETEYYKWDADKNQWVAKVKETDNAEQINSAEIVYDIDEDGQRTYTDKDGMVFFWDIEKNAWFPKIDEDFMARYQMSYGFIDNTSESDREKEKRNLEAAVQKENELAKLVEEAKAREHDSKDATKPGLKRKQPQETPKWFEIDPAHNTKVYVSNLPLDITLEEFADVMGKCGMIMRDPQTQKHKLKLYTESDGQIKGDGLCDYIKVESVDLALKILDEYDLRGHKMRVQRAQFQMRGEYNPALKPKRKKKDKEKLAKIKEKLLDWRPEKMRGERSKHEKTVIIKNLFHPELFEKEVQLILDYQNDLREECSKCGTVKKVVIYDRHSEGVAQVHMSDPEEADLVIQMMHGRFFGKRKLTADHWDGKTKYKIEESEEEVKKRLNKWNQYLEADESKKSDSHKVAKEESLADTQEDTDKLGEIEN